jgi:hypothetical protein
MKYLNFYENFLFESYGINKTVEKYTEEIFNHVKINLLKNNFIFKIDLLSENSFLIKDFKVIIKNGDIYAFFDSRYSIINDDILYDAELSLTFDINNINNDILRGKINHELNHGLHFYNLIKKNIKSSNTMEEQEKLNNHKKLGNNFSHWKSFLNIYYLCLTHEMNSRISECYELLKTSSEPIKELKELKIYKDASLISKFSFETFYKKFIDQYSEKDFMNLTKDMCDCFDYKFISDISFCKKKISDIINFIKKRNNKFIKKLNKLAENINLKESNFFCEDDWSTDFNLSDYIE